MIIVLIQFAVVIVVLLITCYRFYKLLCKNIGYTDYLGDLLETYINFIVEECGCEFAKTILRDTYVVIFNNKGFPDEAFEDIDDFVEEHFVVQED